MVRQVVVRTVFPLLLVAAVAFGLEWFGGTDAPALAGNVSQPTSDRIEAMGRIRVIDGDTIDTYVDGVRTDVGLIGVRAPMRNTLCGRVAADTLRALVADGLWLEDDPDILLDTHQRRMFYAFTADDRSIQLELVRAGVVWTDGQGRDADQLAAAHAEAEANRIGCLFG